MIKIVIIFILIILGIGGFTGFNPLSIKENYLIAFYTSLITISIFLIGILIGDEYRNNDKKDKEEEIKIILENNYTNFLSEIKKIRDLKSFPCALVQTVIKNFKQKISDDDRLNINMKKITSMLDDDLLNISTFCQNQKKESLHEYLEKMLKRKLTL